MKTTISKYFLFFGLSFFILACSTSNDRFFNRQYHALNTKYNVMYNGNLAFDRGYQSLVAEYEDNFWEVLPIERMESERDDIGEEEGNFEAIAVPDSLQGNPDFKKAEDKATKAIQKRSMYIGGRERNSQIDEAYLLLGKSRYHDNRFIPALEAFNYILYKYPDSDKINEAKVWREKTNVRLMYDELAIQNIKEMLKDKKLKNQNKADALATMAQAYLNIGHMDSAVPKLVDARNLTRRVEEKARFNFILGQLYGRLGDKEQALKSFQNVIDMKRNSPRVYTIHSYVNQFEYDNQEKLDSVVFLKKYRKLIKDRENKAYLDLLNRQVALYYLKNNQVSKAADYFKTSLKNAGNDDYLKASNYKNLAEIYFEDAKYEWAGKYYDSTLVVLPQKSKEFFQISKKRDNIKDVLIYESSARTNDSILNIVGMSDQERNTHISKLIEKLKKDDAKKAALEAKAKDNGGQSLFSEIKNPLSGTGSNTPSQGASNFYFYSTNAVSFGKVSFKKRWGNRPLKDNWRWASSSVSSDFDDKSKDKAIDGSQKVGDQIDENEFRYSVDFYKDQIPTDPKEIESIKKDRDFAYFQLGSIYNEKFNELELSAEKFESLLSFNPEQRLILPTKYNLYKIYLDIDPAKAEKMKQNILREHADTRYAELLLNKSISTEDKDSPENIYNSVYKVYETGDYPKAFEVVDKAINRLVDGEYISKFELLKANIIGKLEGLESYRKALNYVSLTYAGKPEAKEAERILNNDIPRLSEIKFTTEPSNNWKIIYEIPIEDLNKSRELERKMRDFIIGQNNPNLKFSMDYYSVNKVFFVLHGLTSEGNALREMGNLKNSTGYDAVVISSENYVVVQIKKEWEEYLKKIKE